MARDITYIVGKTCLERVIDLTDPHMTHVRRAEILLETAYIEGWHKGLNAVTLMKVITPRAMWEGKGEEEQLEMADNARKILRRLEERGFARRKKPGVWELDPASIPVVEDSPTNRNKDRETLYKALVDMGMPENHRIQATARFQESKKVASVTGITWRVPKVFAQALVVTRSQGSLTGTFWTRSIATRVANVIAASTHLQEVRRVFDTLRSNTPKYRGLTFEDFLVYYCADSIVTRAQTGTLQTGKPQAYLNGMLEDLKIPNLDRFASVYVPMLDQILVTPTLSDMLEGMELPESAPRSKSKSKTKPDRRAIAQRVKEEKAVQHGVSVRAIEADIAEALDMGFGGTWQ